MGIEKTTWDLLEPILASIDKSIVIDSAMSVTSTVYRLFIKNTKWITCGYDLTINGNTYTVTNLLCNEWIEVTGTVPLAPVQAQYTLTFVGNPIDGDTVIFGEGTYDATVLFANAPEPNTPNGAPINVQIGATVADTIQNLTDTINTYVDARYVTATNNGVIFTLATGYYFLGVISNGFAPTSHTSAITTAQTVIGLDGPEELTGLTAYAPYLSHSTVLVKKAEMSQIHDSKGKLPMIWLHEIVREKINYDKKLTLDRESECNLYFMIDCDKKFWSNDDHYRYAVKPMRNLMKMVVDALNSSCSVQHPLPAGTDVDAPNWGKYIDDKGMTGKIFGDDLSGTQLSQTIPFVKC